MTYAEWHLYLNGAAAMAGLLVVGGVVASMHVTPRVARYCDTAILVVAALGLVAFLAGFVCLVLA